MSTDYYWANSLDNSSHPAEGEKWIYLVAGSRNVITAHSQGGLWANLGETSRSVEERLEGLDYRRKAAGGDWIILNQWRVPDWISDGMLHTKLRLKPKIKWLDSHNTEEFLFTEDTGDGNNASEYIRSAIMEAVMEESHKQIAGIKSERNSLREKLKKLQDEKSRKDSESTLNKPDLPSSWKDKSSQEMLWKKEVSDQIDKINRPPTPSEIRNEVIFSYLLGLASVLAYLFFKPSMIEFIFLLLPVSSLLSAGIGLIRSRIKWKSRLNIIKEKLK
jgi:hypothetical protein